MAKIIDGNGKIIADHGKILAHNVKTIAENWKIIAEIGKLIAGNGNNIIASGSGNDTITLGTGHNRITLGYGNDNITIANTSNNQHDHDDDRGSNQGRRGASGRDRCIVSVWRSSKAEYWYILKLLQEIRNSAIFFRDVMAFVNQNYIRSLYVQPPDRSLVGCHHNSMLFP